MKAPSDSTKARVMTVHPITNSGDSELSDVKANVVGRHAIGLAVVVQALRADNTRTSSRICTAVGALG